jgi:hypothetical protein
MVRTDFNMMISPLGLGYLDRDRNVRPVDAITAQAAER